jgi:LacI family transcriptional regulator
MDNSSDKRPTLKTLAEITGLGISTVSQALRDSPAIAEETRRRVKLAAQQAGYRPNRAGVRLRTGKTNVITVVLNPQDEGSGFFADFVFGISNGLAGTPYHLVVTPYSLEDEMAPIRYIVETASADGVIMSRAQPNDQRARYLHENGIPFVTHGRTELNFAHPYHDYDNEAYAYKAMEILKDRGRKRIALLGPPHELSYHIHTNRGFERGLRDFGLEAFPIGSADIDQNLESIRKLGFELARAEHGPDGIVCSGVTAAVVVTKGMEDGGKVIGQDFDIVSKHTTTLIAVTGPKIISIPEDFRMAGYRLAKLLIQSIDGVPAEALQEIVGPSST